MMKKVILLILGIWDAVMAFLSPLWIAVAAICFSGRIHLLDESFNESLAGALGAVFLTGQGKLRAKPQRKKAAVEKAGTAKKAAAKAPAKGGKAVKRVASRKKASPASE